MEQGMLKSLEMDGELITRMTGLKGYSQSGETVDINDNTRLSIFKSPKYDDLHLIIDGAGGYRCFQPETSLIMRSGHLSEFDTKGFEQTVDIFINITDEDVFRKTFGGFPGEDSWDSVPAGFFQMNKDMSDLFSLKQIFAGPMNPDDFPHDMMITLKATCLDEARMMAELNEIYSALWGGQDGFPGSRSDAVVEACLISNDNPGPDECGFEIEHYCTHEPVEEPVQTLSSPEPF